jgi:hypothetical protein
VERVGSSADCGPGGPPLQMRRIDGDGTPPARPEWLQRAHRRPNRVRGVRGTQGTIGGVMLSGDVDELVATTDQECCHAGSSFNMAGGLLAVDWLGLADSHLVVPVPDA